MDYRCAVFLIRLDGRLFGGAARFGEIPAVNDYFANRDLPTSCGVAARFLPDESHPADDFHLLSNYLDIDGLCGFYRHSNFTQENYK